MPVRLLSFVILSFSLGVGEVREEREHDALPTLSFTYHVWTMMLLKVPYCNYAVFFLLVIVQFLGYLHWQEKLTLSILFCYVSRVNSMKEWHKLHF